jgi:hypothetical protein
MALGMAAFDTVLVAFESGGGGWVRTLFLTTCIGRVDLDHGEVLRRGIRGKGI